MMQCNGLQNSPHVKSIGTNFDAFLLRLRTQSGIGINKSCRKSRAIRTSRSGAALVEFAVSLPVLMLLILGSMEASSAVFVRQALVTSAYEGIREVTRHGSTTTDGNARAQNILTARNIRNSTITFTPADPGNAARGTKVTIQVSAPFAANSPFFGKVISDRTCTVQSVMVKE